MPVASVVSWRREADGAAGRPRSGLEAVPGAAQTRQSAPRAHEIVASLIEALGSLYAPAMPAGARHITFVVGARPNFMKAAPVHRALQEAGAEVTLVHTGQHYDAEMSDVFLSQLGLPKPDVFLGVGSGTHGQQTAKALVGIEEVLLERRPDMVVVPGDVNSTLAGALAAVKLDIPIAHLEAGLRSYDNRMPEEHNRLLTDHLSSVLLVHSESALGNLAREGIDLELAHFVGNTMIDSVFAHVDAARAEKPWEELRHRARNVRPRHPAPPRARGRPGAPDRNGRGAEGPRRHVSDPLPGAPAHPAAPGRARARGGASRGQGPAEPAARVPGLPRAAGGGPLPAHGLGRRTGGDVGARCPLLHAPRARRSGPSRSSSARTPCSAHGPTGSRRFRRCWRRRSPVREIPLWDGAAGPRAAEVLLRALD